MNWTKKWIYFCAFLGAVSVGGFSNAGQIDGVVYSVANGFTQDGRHAVGSHFHSSNLENLPAENPEIPFTGMAEVGGFFGDEEVRGIAEFDLTGQSVVQSAILKFDPVDLVELGIDFNQLGGLFGQTELDASFNVVAFAGNNTEERGDYEASPITSGPLATYVAGSIVAGETLELDITSLFNEQVQASSDSLGIRLQLARSNANSGALTFNNFRIVTVPEPNACLLLLMGVAAMARNRRRR